jgi:hypothetical protein
MSNDSMQTALTTWAAQDLPARLLAGQVAKLLNCTTDDIAILVSAGKMRPLGRPNPNAVKFFSSIELITLLADREWLDEATKTIGQYWRCNGVPQRIKRMRPARFIKIYRRDGGIRGMLQGLSAPGSARSFRPTIKMPRGRSSRPKTGPRASPVCGKWLNTP